MRTVTLTHANHALLSNRIQDAAALNDACSGSLALSDYQRFVRLHSHGGTGSGSVQSPMFAAWARSSASE